MESIAVSIARPHALSPMSGAQPVPVAGEVELHAGQAGLCGSDRHILHSTNPSPGLRASSATNSPAGFLPATKASHRLVVSRLENGRLDPAAMIIQTCDARDACAAFDFVETHPDRLLKVQLAFDE